MNAPFHISAGTISDLVDWAIEENRWPHLQWTAKAIYALELGDTLADAKAILHRWESKDAWRRANKHWAYDSNRAITTRQFLKLIEDYEAYRAAGAVAEFAYDNQYQANRERF